MKLNFSQLKRPRGPAGIGKSAALLFIILLEPCSRELGLLWFGTGFGVANWVSCGSGMDSEMQSGESGEGFVDLRSRGVVESWVVA